MWAMACLFEMQLLDSSDVYRLKLHLCLITFTSYLNCPNSKRSLPFVIIQGYILFWSTTTTTKVQEKEKHVDNHFSLCPLLVYLVKV